jgi:hypothetical protein
MEKCLGAPGRAHSLGGESPLHTRGFRPVRGARCKCAQPLIERYLSARPDVSHETFSERAVIDNKSTDGIFLHQRAVI